MKIADILNDKGRDVIAVGMDVSLTEASKLLTKSRIGALLVQDKRGGLAGIISERDIVRAIADKGPAGLDLPVRDRMTKDVAACTEADTLKEILEVMTRCRFRHMPVLENGRIAGIVSIGDVAKMGFKVSNFPSR